MVGSSDAITDRMLSGPAGARPTVLGRLHGGSSSMRRTPALPASATTEQRFWAKVEWSEGCWAWLGASSAGGYGRFWTGERFTAAHRYAYAIAVGPIGQGMHVDHLCRNPNCVNPAHLEEATPRLNQLRGFGKGADRASQTHCARGHEFTPENTRMTVRNQRVCRTCQSRTTSHRPSRKYVRKYDTDEARHAAWIAAGRSGGAIGGKRAAEWSRTPEGRAAKSRAGASVSPEMRVRAASIANCLRWSIRRGQPCKCGNHDPLSAISRRKAA